MRKAVSLGTVSAAGISHGHALLAWSAFLSALLVGIQLHYTKICTNEWYGPPLEWFPSVSAAIGDRYPERAIFQILLAFASGPRLGVIGLWYLMTRRGRPTLSVITAVAGVVRTVAAVSFAIITSGDDHDVHDILMFIFLFATPLWMGGSIALAPRYSSSRKWKTRVAMGFFGAIPPMIYLFIQHKVHQVPGAYSQYALFEWTLTLCDIGFDATFAFDLAELEVEVTHVLWDSEREKRSTTLKGSRKVAKAAIVSRPFWRDGLAFLSESILGYCFFTTLTALAPCIFFFNVYNMGMAGQEALLLTHLAVTLVAIRPLREFIAKHAAVFQLLSLCGLMGYRDDYESHRLVYMSFATALQSLTYASIWHSYSDQPDLLESQGRALGVGIVATVVAKLANHSLNPAWPFVDHRSGGHNAIVLGAAVIACFEKWLRPSVVPASSRGEPDAEPNYRFALGFGALLFALHQFLSDSGSIIARTWSGYPVSGPMAMPHGALVVFAMAIGLALPLSLPMLAIAPVGLAVLYRQENWPGFAGGLAFAICTMSALPSFLRGIASRPKPARNFLIAYLVYDLFVLADVWTVAYAFVPGGWLLREKTDIVLTAMMLALAPAISDAVRLSAVRTSRSIVITRLMLALLAMYAGYACVASLQAAAQPMPHFAEERIMTAGIWTVHFGMDGWMWESQRRMQQLFIDAELDVIGLLESDLHRIVFGNRDLTQYIAGTLGYYVDLGPGPQKHTWGATLLSKFPIINSTHHLLPSPVGELAPAIHATLDVYGSYIDVIVAHNGQEEDAHDRQLQSMYMADLMRAAYPRPLIFLGYVVTLPQAPKPAPYWILVEDGRMLDIDPTDQNRWCEYILYRGLQKVAYARITRGSLPSVTDTELQTARFRVPSAPVNPDVDVTGNERVPGQSVPLSWQYSSKFTGKGIRGHRFHELGNGNEALYYRPVRRSAVPSLWSAR